MDLGLSWINDLVLWLARWVPRWAVCEMTHRGVKFRGGFFWSMLGKSRMDIIEIEPGVFWYWPVSTRVVKYPVVRQAVDCSAQSMSTRDGESIMVSTVLVVRIRDVVKALTENYEVDDTIREVGAAAAVASVAGRTWTELREAFANGDVDKELKDNARGILDKYGVSVMEARFTDCCKHTALRTEGGGSGTIVPIDSDED